MGIGSGVGAGIGVGAIVAPERDSARHNSRVDRRASIDSPGVGAPVGQPTSHVPLAGASRVARRRPLVAHRRARRLPVVAARLLIGGACAQCQATQDTKPLEFAHLEPTGLNGRSRGKSRRLFNILKHPDKYVLLCVDCHDDLDGMNRFRQQDYLSHQ